MLKRFILIAGILVLFVAKAAPGEIHQIVISGSAAAVPISATSTSVHWIQMVAPSGNMSTAYWGDGTLTTSNGGLLPAGAGQMLPPTNQGGYDLTQVYVYVASGDKLNIEWDVY